MIVTADDSVEDLDEALTWLNADYQVARLADDVGRAARLAEEIDGLLAARLTAGGSEKSSTRDLPEPRSGTFSPRHRGFLSGEPTPAGFGQL